MPLGSFGPTHKDTLTPGSYTLSGPNPYPVSMTALLRSSSGPPLPAVSRPLSKVPRDSRGSTSATPPNFGPIRHNPSTPASHQDGRCRRRRRGGEVADVRDGCRVNVLRRTRDSTPDPTRGPECRHLRVSEPTLNPGRPAGEETSRSASLSGDLGCGGSSVGHGPHLTAPPPPTAVWSPGLLWPSSASGRLGRGARTSKAPPPPTAGSPPSYRHRAPSGSPQAPGTHHLGPEAPRSRESGRKGRSTGAVRLCLRLRTPGGRREGFPGWERTRPRRGPGGRLGVVERLRRPVGPPR